MYKYDMIAYTDYDLKPLVAKMHKLDPSKNIVYIGDTTVAETNEMILQNFRIYLCTFHHPELKKLVEQYSNVVVINSYDSSVSHLKQILMQIDLLLENS